MTPQELDTRFYALTEGLFRDRYHYAGRSIQGIFSREKDGSVEPVHLYTWEVVSMIEAESLGLVKILPSPAPSRCLAELTPMGYQKLFDNLKGEVR